MVDATWDPEPMKELAEDKRVAAVRASGPTADEKAFPLALAANGERLRIVAFRTGKGLSKRLGGLGLHKGSIVEVALRQTNGSVVVSHDGNRVALGASTAQMIIVTLSPA